MANVDRSLVCVRARWSDWVGGGSSERSLRDLPGRRHLPRHGRVQGPGSRGEGGLYRTPGSLGTRAQRKSSSLQVHVGLKGLRAGLRTAVT